MFYTWWSCPLEVYVIFCIFKGISIVNTISLLPKEGIYFKCKTGGSLNTSDEEKAP